MADKSRGTWPGRRLVALYEWLRHPEACLSGKVAAPSNSVAYLTDARYLLLESQRADGTAVATPMWFAILDDTIFLRTESSSPKIRRIRRHPVVKVASCTVRGKPLGDYIECVARVVPQEREPQAEEALRRTYGLARRLFNGLVRNEYVYLELAPINTKQRPVSEDGATRALHTGRTDTETRLDVA